MEPLSDVKFLSLSPANVPAKRDTSNSSSMYVPSSITASQILYGPSHLKDDFETCIFRAWYREVKQPVLLLVPRNKYPASHRGVLFPQGAYAEGKEWLLQGPRLDVVIGANRSAVDELCSKVKFAR